jgi:hypothetical protein
VWWYTTLYQVEPVLWTSITTSRHSPSPFQTWTNVVSEWFLFYDKSANFSTISWREHVTFDNDVCVVLDQHINLCSASSLTQQSTDRHVASLRHIIMIPSQPVFALTPEWCVLIYILAELATITNFIVFALTRSGSNQRSTTLVVSTLTITPSMWSVLLNRDN